MSSLPETAACVRIAAPPDDLCLRFANTRYWRGSAEPTEDLRQPADLLNWVEAEAGLPPAAVRQIGAVWQKAGNAEAAFAEALRVRETLFRLFAGLAAGRPSSAADIAELNRELEQTPQRSRIVLTTPPGWLVPPLAPQPMALLAPVLWSAGDLALGPRAGRVRQCANPECQWLFLDDSKSGNRRWCSMSACGNRAKAHRHYLKQKGRRASG